MASRGKKTAETSLDRLDRPLPLVARVEQALRRAIADGAFPEGRLPTEVELAERFGVSRETVRRAAHVLEREGLLRKFRRRGTLLGPLEKLPGEAEAASRRLVAYLSADYRTPDGQHEGVTDGTAERMLQGALEEAGRHELELIVRSVSPDRLRRAVEQISLGRTLRGAIVASFAEEKLLRRLGGRALPIVLADHDTPLPRTSSIRDDSAAGSQMAVAHLVQLGHRRLAYAHWHRAELNPWRLRGFRQGLRAAGIAPRRKAEFLVEISPAGAARLVEQLLTLKPRPTALVAFNNTLAWLVVEACRSASCRVPEELSIVGCGGQDVVGLSTVQSDWYDLGRRAMQLLVQQIDRPSAPVEHHCLAPRLLAGQTAAALE